MPHAGRVGAGLRSVLALGLGIVLAGCGSTRDGGFFENLGRNVAGTTRSGLTVGRNIGVSVSSAVTGFTTGFIERMAPGDLEEAAEAHKRSIETGEAQTWSNPETGATGTVQTTPAAPRPAAPTQVRVAELVEVDAPMTAVGEPYVVKATSGVNVRAGPGTQYPAIMTLPGGERVMAIARLQDDDWFLIGQGAVGQGYVRGDLIESASAEFEEPAPLPEQVTESRQVEVSMAAECYTTTQSVSLADGAKEEATVTQCRTPDGWVQV